MNSIDGVLARIQEILTRIHEIQATDGRVQGMGPSATASVKQPISAPRTTGSGSQSTSNSKSASNTKSAQFQQLLNEALSAGTNTSSGAGPGGLTSAALGGLGNLESILGGTVNNGLGNASGALGATGLGGQSTATPGLGSSASSLQQYQSELLQALQELAAQRQKQQSQ